MKSSSFKKKFDENQGHEEIKNKMDSKLSSNNSTIEAAGSKVPMNDDRSYEFIREEPQVRLEDFKDTEIVDIELPEDTNQYKLEWMEE
jgi:hypothetical protein